MKISGLAIRSDQPHILGGDSGRLLADKHDQLTAKHLHHHGYPQIELHLIFIEPGPTRPHVLPTITPQPSTTPRKPREQLDRPRRRRRPRRQGDGRKPEGAVGAGEGRGVRALDDRRPPEGRVQRCDRSSWSSVSSPSASSSDQDALQPTMELQGILATRALRFPCPPFQVGAPAKLVGGCLDSSLQGSPRGTSRAGLPK